MERELRVTMEGQTSPAPLVSTGKPRKHCGKADLKNNQDDGAHSRIYLTPNVECATTEQREPRLPATDERPEEPLSQTRLATAPISPKVESPSNDGLKPTPALNQDPRDVEMETEQENLEATQTVKQETPQSESGDMSDVEPSRKESFKSPTVSMDKTELLSMNYTQERSLYPDSDSQFPNLVDNQEAVSALDMEEGSLLPQSEDEEEEEDDELIKRHGVDLKQDLQEVKSELLLDDMSSISHGDESSSGFLGSPGEPDLQLSMEPGLVPGSRSHGDNLLTETDDSLPFEPFRSDREKARRRGSPGRSRVKQVNSSLAICALKSSAISCLGLFLI